MKEYDLSALNQHSKNFASFIHVQYYFKQKNPYNEFEYFIFQSIQKAYMFTPDILKISFIVVCLILIKSAKKKLIQEFSNELCALRTFISIVFTVRSALTFFTLFTWLFLLAIKYVVEMTQICSYFFLSNILQ